MMKVAINGWSRIGRLVFRAALRDHSAIDLNDTLFGEWKEIKIRGESDPKNLPGRGLGVDVESTGIKGRNDSSKHPYASCKKERLIALAKDPDVTLDPRVSGEI